MYIGNKVDLVEWLRNILQDSIDEASIKSAEIGIIFVKEENFSAVGHSCLVVCDLKVSKSEVFKFEAVKDHFRHEIGAEIDRGNCSYTKIVVNFNVRVTEPISKIYCELKTAGKIKEENNMRQLPEIKKIIHSGDYTHIIWADNSKTSVKRAEDTPYDAYSAFAQAVVKKLYGSTENAKFEHELRQLSEKEQKKVVSEKETRRAKQQKAEKKKLDKELAKQERELKEKTEQVQATRAKRQSMFKRSEV